MMKAASETLTEEGKRQKELAELNTRAILATFARAFDTDDGLTILRWLDEQLLAAEPVPGRSSNEEAWHYLGVLRVRHGIQRQIDAGRALTKKGSNSG